MFCIWRFISRHGYTCNMGQILSYNAVIYVLPIEDHITEKDGHVWMHSYKGDYCIHCGRRIEHYEDSNKSLSKWDCEIPINILSTMICSHMIAAPIESDYIAPVGWGTYYRRQHIQKRTYNEIPELAYDTVKYGTRPQIKEFHNDSLLVVGYGR